MRYRKRNEESVIVHEGIGAEFSGDGCILAVPELDSDELMEAADALENAALSLRRIAVAEYYGLEEE